MFKGQGRRKEGGKEGRREYLDLTMRFIRRWAAFDSLGAKIKRMYS